MSRKELKPLTAKIRLQDECEKISRDFVGQLPDLLNRLSQDEPYKAIQSWVEITKFVTPQKSKEGGKELPMNINITMLPAKQIEAKEDNYIDITPEKDENE